MNRLLLGGWLLCSLSCADEPGQTCREVTGVFEWGERGHDAVPMTDLWVHVDETGTLFARATRSDGSVASYNQPGKYATLPLGSSPLSTLAGDSTGKLLALGGDGAAFAVTLGDTTGWVQAPELEVDAEITALASGAAGEFWAVGSAGFVGHFNGETWSVAQHGDQLLRAVWADAESVWVVGEDSLLRGTALDAFDEVAAPIAGLRAIAGLSSERFWVVGDEGAFFEWDGAGFAEIDSGTAAQLRGVWADPEDGVWAVGEQGTVLHLPLDARAAAPESLPGFAADYGLSAVAGARAPRLAGSGSSTVVSVWAGSDDGPLLSRQISIGTACR